MTDEQVFGDDEPSNQKKAGPKIFGVIPAAFAMPIVVVLLLLTLFLSWYGTWFGRSISNEKLAAYLHDKEKPRNVQHAVAQIGERIIKGDKSVLEWYPALIETSKHPSPEVRLTAAWAMGQDNSYPEFRSALLGLLEDSHPGVRHNAALSLVRFNDATGRPELVRMLSPYTLRAETGGTIELIIEEEGVAVAGGSPLARITDSGGNASIIHAPEDGRVERVMASDDAVVEAGAELMVLLPSTNQVWESLRALYLIGQPEDAPHILRYTRPGPGVPEHVQKQAAATLEAIRARSENAANGM